MLIITVAAAIVTPTPDATTMLVFMAPMVVLYFVGVLVSYVVLRKKQSQSDWPRGRRINVMTCTQNVRKLLDGVGVWRFGGALRRVDRLRP